MRETCEQRSWGNAGGLYVRRLPAITLAQEPDPDTWKIFFKYFILGQKNDECFPTLLPIIGAIIPNMVWKCFTYLATTSSRVRLGELRGGWATIRVGPGFQFIFNSSTQFCIPLNLLMLHDEPRFQSWFFSHSILLTLLTWVFCAVATNWQEEISQSPPELHQWSSIFWILNTNWEKFTSSISNALMRR